MNFYAFSAIVNGVFALSAALLINHSCPIKGLRWTYILFCVSVLWWSVFYFLWQIAQNQYSALVFCRLLMVGAVFIPISNLHHVIILLNSEKRYATLLKSLYFLDAVWVIVTAFTPYIVRDVVSISVFTYWPMAGVLFTPFLATFAFTVLFAIYLIVQSLFSAAGVKRTQLFYVLVGTLIGWCGAATNFPLWYRINFPPVGNILVSGYIFCVGYAIVRYRLMDVNVIIRKTLIYSVVTGILTAVYLSVIALLAKISQGFYGYQNIFSPAIAAGLITVAFQPLRKRVQVFIDAKFFRQYVDREEKLYELSREVITHTTPEAMAEALMHVLQETLHPKSGALFLRAKHGDGFERVSKVGSASLPELMEDVNGLAVYFKTHPQPFVQNISDDVGHSQDTRRKREREDAA